MTRSAAAGAAIASLAAIATLVAPRASAQSFDDARPATFVTGTPGGSRCDRVDGARTGLSTTPLPSGGLRTVWHASLGIVIEVPPLVDAENTTYVVGSRGEVVALGPQGDERWRASTGSVQPGPPALLSDDTLVFVDAVGEAVAVRQGVVRWRTRFGRGGTYRPAPIALDDGGVIVATSHEIAILDAEGNERSRVVLPEAAAAPLVAGAGRVFVVTASGAVWAWPLGGPETTRVGSFDGPIDGAAVLVGPRTLLAVAGAGAGGSRQARLVAIDIENGAFSLRASASASSAARWLGPPAVRASIAYVQMMTPTAELAVAIDPSGAELGRAAIAMQHPGVAAAFGAGLDAGAGDAGLAMPAPVAHTAPLVDSAGTMAFATTEGGLGVVTGLATTMGTIGAPVVEVVVDACPPTVTGSHANPPVAGLAPLGRERERERDDGAARGSRAAPTGSIARSTVDPSGAGGGFVAACASGTVLAVRSSSQGGVRGRSTPPPP